MKMVIDSLSISMLIFLFTLFSFNPVSSSASQLSSNYNTHCASIVPESSPIGFKLNLLNSFPLGYYHRGYLTGGDRIVGAATPLYPRSFFYLETSHIRATKATDLFQIEGTVSLRSNTPFYYHVGNYSKLNYETQRAYGRHRGRYVKFDLVGFWSKSSGNVCMVGAGYSKTGNPLNLQAVFKLSNVFNESNISSLINGSLESLSSENDENYFEPISVLMLPKGNYTYSLDSIETENECFSRSDSEKGLSLKPSSLCSHNISVDFRRLQLEYSSDCNSSKNCTPIRGTSENLPSLMSLKVMECSRTEKHRLRVLVGFLHDSYSEVFNPKTMLVGEGWWDEKKNRLCIVACHFMGMASSSLANTHVGDCSIRLTLRIPSILSIKNTGSIVGQIWSNKTASDPSYFKSITFRNYEDAWVRVQGLMYEYSQLDRVRKLCHIHDPAKNHGKRYPNPFSYNMRFDMSIRDFNRRVAWGYSIPLSVGDQFYELSQPLAFGSSTSSSIAGPIVNPNNSSLFNVSYQISMSFMSNSTLGDRNSLFYKSSERVMISAEGTYDAGSGTLCMVGCRDLLSRNEVPTAHSKDCEILVKFQFPPLDTNNASFIKGSIESTRKNSDSLYFKQLELSSSAFYAEALAKAVWRIDMEVIMVLISTTLACVFVGLQLYHVKRHPNVLPFISIIMMSILTLGHMIPLVLNFEAIFAQNSSNKNYIFGNFSWLEVNEITVRLITMVAFLLQFRLLQLAWSARNRDESKKGLWVAERNASCFTLPMYAAGFIIALLFKLKKDVYQQHSYWEDLKSYGGLVSDGFLLPQIMLNLFSSNLRDNVLSCSFYIGATFVRLLPHAYDLYRTHNYASTGSYYYADPTADFYSTAWDIVIPLGGILFAIIIYLQQRFGAQCILPRRFRGFETYEKVPALVTEPEAEVETTNM